MFQLLSLSDAMDGAYLSGCRSILPGRCFFFIKRDFPSFAKTVDNHLQETGESLPKSYLSINLLKLASTTEEKSHYLASIATKGR